MAERRSYRAGLRTARPACHAAAPRCRRWRSGFPQADEVRGRPETSETAAAASRSRAPPAIARRKRRAPPMRCRTGRSPCRKSCTRTYSDATPARIIAPAMAGARGKCGTVIQIWPEGRAALLFAPDALEPFGALFHGHELAGRFVPLGP